MYKTIHPLDVVHTLRLFLKYKGMKHQKSIIITVCFAALSVACNPSKSRMDQQGQSTTSVPKGFECFDSPRVYIEYKQPIHGYTVKAMWLPYIAEDGTTGETGHTTLLHFQSTDNEFTINLNAKQVFDTLCYHYPHLKDGEVLYWDYAPKGDDEILPRYSPITFLDVDFDGEEELLIMDYLNGSYDNNTYKVYKVHENYAELMAEEPFDYLETSAQFNSINKTITTISSGGQDSTYTYIYQLKDYDIMYGDQPKRISRFEMVKADIYDHHGHRVYSRKGNKLELSR